MSKRLFYNGVEIVEAPSYRDGYRKGWIYGAAVGVAITNLIWQYAV